MSNYGRNSQGQGHAKERLKYPRREPISVSPRETMAAPAGIRQRYSDKWVSRSQAVASRRTPFFMLPRACWLVVRIHPFIEEQVEGYRPESNAEDSGDSAKNWELPAAKKPEDT